MCKYLPEYGIRPIVLTVDPNQATYPQRDVSLLDDVQKGLEVIHTPTSEWFGTYQRASGRKEVPFSGFANESDKPGPRQKLARWVRGNFFLPDPRRGWNSHAIKKALQLIDERGIDTVVTTSPPHSTQLIGRALSQARGVRWIADFRDPWTDIYYYKQFYPTRLARALDAGMERKVLEDADAVLVVSEEMKRVFSSKVANPGARFHVVPNGFDEADFPPYVPKVQSPFVLTYTGTLAGAYPLDGLLKAVETLKGQVVLRFVGNRDEKTEKMLAALPFVKLEGPKPHARAIAAMQDAQALLLVIPDIPKNEGILTGKIFEYLAAGPPILALGPVQGDAARILNETEKGVMLNYNDVAKIGLVLERWIQGEAPLGNNTHQSFSRRKLAGAVAEVLKA